MKWLLGAISALLLLNVFAQQQTISDLRAELRKANGVLSVPLPAPANSSTASQDPQISRPIPHINWSGDRSTCNKWDKGNDWWRFTHAYLSDRVKYADYKVWFLYSQSYVDTFAFCFDKTFVNKVNEIASTVS